MGVATSFEAIASWVADHILVASRTLVVVASLVAALVIMAYSQVVHPWLDSYLVVNIVDLWRQAFHSLGFIHLASADHR